MSSSRVKDQGYQGQKVLCTPITPGSVRMVRARCKQRHSTADGTIPSLPGVILAACVRFMFGKTSLAVVFCLSFFSLFYRTQ